ncbi:MAG: NusG domain II-containing protein [Clostridiales bacterium]|nr:NusG domain II-containing protein [Clostridiales bacterium]
MHVKKGDVILTVIILLTALALFIAFLSMPSQNITAVISVDGVVKNKIVLTGLKEPITLKYKNLGYCNIVQAANGKICVESADCPTQDCVHTGWINRAGQTIICLPSHLIIKLEGSNGKNIDTVVG